MRKRLGTLVAVSALVFAACGGTTATVAPSAASNAPATTPPSTAPTPVPSQAPPPIDITATKYKAEAVLNLSNIDYVYTKDPRKFKDAKPIKEISWKNFRKIVGNKWDPGKNLPFDPTAARQAQTNHLKVIIANGKNLKNLQNILSDKNFLGTTIK